MAEIKLGIDTSNSDHIFLTLVKNNRKYKKKIVQKTFTSQILIKEIVIFLGKYNLKPADIDEINVNRGPGSFTGLRVGISVANTIGWYLSVPVNGKSNTQVQPRYD